MRYSQAMASRHLVTGMCLYKPVCIQVLTGYECGKKLKDCVKLLCVCVWGGRRVVRGCQCHRPSGSRRPPGEQQFSGVL